MDEKQVDLACGQIRQNCEDCQEGQACGPQPASASSAAGLAPIKRVKIRHRVYPTVVHYKPNKRPYLFAALYEFHTPFSRPVNVVSVNIVSLLKQVVR